METSLFIDIIVENNCIKGICVIFTHFSISFFVKAHYGL